MILGEIGEMTSVALPRWLQAREYDPHVRSTHSARGLYVFSILFRHAVKNDAVKPVYVHTMAYHACRENRVGRRDIAWVRKLKQLQDLSYAVCTSATR